MKITKIRAITESTEHPQYSCYEHIPSATVDAILASRNQKENTMPAMHPNLTGVSDFPKPTPKRFVPGINGSNSINSILGALQGLGLCSSELSKPLTTLAANGQAAIIGKFLTIDIHQLDRALAETDASTSNRLAFKAALSQMGLLK